MVPSRRSTPHSIGEQLHEEKAVAAAARAGLAQLDGPVAAGVVHLDAHGPVRELALTPISSPAPCRRGAARW